MQATMESTSKSRVFTYENGLLLLLGFTFGIVFFERNAIGPLASYIINDLKLNQAQIGMLGSGLSLAWAIAAYAIGAWSDRSGLRKPFLLVSVVVFSLCSAFSGVAATPDSAEHSENTTTDTSRNGLRTPLRSDHAPTA